MFEIICGGYYTSKKFRAGRGIERTVSYYELELSTTDKSRSFFNDYEYNRGKGDIFLGKPGEQRKTFGDFECFYLHFYCTDKRFEEKYINILPNYIHSFDYMEIKNTIQECVLLHEKSKSEKKHENEYKILINSILTGFFIKVYLKFVSAPFESAGYGSNITNACKFIEEHFRENITIDNIAHAAALSTSFTYVQFKKETGKTPHEYLTEKRLEYARFQLMFSKKTITLISEECGFSNQNYLNQIFPKKYGMTPMQYRRKFREY